jgi:death on curing protein
MKFWRSTINRSSDMENLTDFAMPPGLESAVATPEATFGGEFLHDSITAMAAAYLFHLCQNHAFIAGNKRAGANAAITFLLMNDREPVFDADELVELVFSVASGVLAKPALTEVFRKGCRPVEGS